MRIAITGHRPSKLNNDYDLTSDLMLSIKDELQSIIDKYQPTDMITGMALGIDTLWAKLAIENEIYFIAAIPCLNQDKMWLYKSKDIYREILEHKLCRPYIITNSTYTSDCMQKRNIWMVDKCDLLVAVWNGSKGGTLNCIKYAKTQDKKILLINPNNLSQLNLNL